MRITGSADRRVVYGADLAEVLASVRQPLKVCRYMGRVNST